MTYILRWRSGSLDVQWWIVRHAMRGVCQAMPERHEIWTQVREERRRDWLDLKAPGKILTLHTVPEGAEDFNAISLFWRESDRPEVLSDAARVTPVRQAGGNYERIVVADHAVGYDYDGGAYTEVYSVITDPHGNVVTMFPGVPRR